MISFTIPTQGNAVPYKRTTQRQKWCDENYKKYQAFKKNVRELFIFIYGKYPHQVFNKGEKYYLDIKIYFYDKKHGDSDNVFKGIADAIFAKPLNDKNIAGSFDFFYDKENPRVEVKIYTEEEKQTKELEQWQNAQNAEFLAYTFKDLL